MDKELLTEEKLQNILKLVNAVKKIRQELRDEGIPIDEYERVFIDGEDPQVVFGNEELLEQCSDKVL